MQAGHGPAAGKNCSGDHLHHDYLANIGSWDVWRFLFSMNNDLIRGTISTSVLE